jgi:superfamily I DNA/RNA helicase
MEWSDIKQKVFRFESDIVVSAGAGSGKTAALVELYLRLLTGETALLRPLSVEEIVAITFTDKAAVEMKERVRREIRKRLAGGTPLPTGKGCCVRFPPPVLPPFMPSAPASYGKIPPKPGSIRRSHCWTI